MKRIYRDAKNEKIAGICAGLGDLFSIDPTIIRLAVVFLAIVTWFLPVVGAYVVGWIIIPTKEELIARGELTEETPDER